jgi:soluble lytic murein transglycosylase-like protein
MSFRVLTVVSGVVAAISSAATISGGQAQERGAQPHLAAVDAFGRVAPISSGAASVEHVNVRRAGSPCKIGQPLAAAEARALVTKIAAQENFYPDFVLSVARSESEFNSIALSDKGAFGLMQLMPATAERFKVDLCDPAGNVLGGVRYLRALHEKYRNPFFILAAYNAGEEAVERNRGVPPYPETVRFVSQVINDFYTWPAPGGATRHDARGAVSSAPDLIEPAGPHAAANATAAPDTKPTAHAGWEDGFVMHID